MQQVTATFKYAIGQILKNSSDPVGYGPWLMVVTRLYEECPGGVQYHYYARPWSMGNTGVPTGACVRLHEIELRELTADEEEWRSMQNTDLAMQIDKIKKMLGA